LTNDRVMVIAEAGVNHNGSPEMALRLVDAAAETGADLVKFQTFKAEALVTASAPKADYQNRNAPETKSQFEMLKALELDRATHEALIARCKQKGIGFLSTPFDPESVDLLTRDLGLKLVKVSSGDLTNAPLLLQLAKSGAYLMVSTGMANLY
jgi:sialic acid synthase SpsE